MSRYRWWVALMITCCCASAEEARSSTAEAIQDNSFLVEEAYNQEPGVVQHILTLSSEETRAWTLSFTQEWPLFSQTHQFSYTVPYTFRDHADGLEDILLNYRFQALTETASRPAFAPRFSLILPTGDADHGFSSDTVGYQFNLPLSKVLTDNLTAHANAGLTLLPDAAGGDDLENFNLGGSIIYAVTSDFNLMLELVGNWREDAAGSRPAAVVASPGFRYAVNFEGGAQLVLGTAAPIGLTSAAPNYGVFLYVSFEHAFTKEP